LTKRTNRIVPIKWVNGALEVLDQLLLPLKEEWITCTTASEVAATIKDMNVRGAPAIGVAAAFGCVLGMKPFLTGKNAESCQSTGSPSIESLKEEFSKIKKELGSTRPTAVNLFCALKRMEELFLSLCEDKGALCRVFETLENEACLIRDEDEAFCEAIGHHGLPLIPPNASIITHCNAGALATAAYGTALGVIRAAHEKGLVKKVYCDETRPYLQGARLTTWELHKDGIPCVLICDNMAGSLMASNKVSLVVVGADRIAANGDVANKIGTYSLAVLCKYHNIPFYVAAPLTTFDMSIEDGSLIPIEQRSTKEVTTIGETVIAPPGVEALHPAFDVTPASLITAIITNAGVIKYPDRDKVKQHVTKDKVPNND
jgi:methylthioribose-1-phosphate isomerase